LAHALEFLRGLGIFGGLLFLALVVGGFFLSVGLGFLGLFFLRLFLGGFVFFRFLAFFFL
jgi:hypothetical protein